MLIFPACLKYYPSALASVLIDMQNRTSEQQRGMACLPEAKGWWGGGEVTKNRGRTERNKLGAAQLVGKGVCIADRDESRGVRCLAG